MANPSWLNMYPVAEAIFFQEGLFDHTPVILTVYPSLPSGRKPFKYFPMWSSSPHYQKQVADSWKVSVVGTKMYQIVTKLKRLKPVLTAINKQGFADVQGEEMRVKELMNECQQRLNHDPLNVTLMQQEKEVREQYAEKHKVLISFLQQKSKVNWIKNGDSNTSVFHSSIKDRTRKNRILSVVNAQGDRVDDQEKITEAFLDYYKELLGTSMIGRQRVKTSVMNEGPLITSTHAEALMTDFSKEEIKAAMFSIPGVKSPGPDGYGSYFFQDNWELVGDETCEAIASFLKSVSLNQGGFIKGRYIAHNIMICQDLIRNYGRKESKPNCMIKLDLQKAYDTMDWDFLEEMLHAFEFPEKFISGMEEREIKNVLDMTGFSRQDAPFKYLGVPICARKIAASDCVTLAQKMTNKIRYGQLEICHMLGGKSIMEEAGAVGWDNLCYPKKEGGLGLLNIAQWNIAAMFKHIWAVANKKDNLWVKWVHCVYIKNHNWWEYKASQSSSWYWRKMVSIKDLVKQTLNYEEFSKEEYKVAAGYKLLVQEQGRVDWCNEVWSRINTPKHSFLTWLAILQRLKTKDRLCRFRVIDSPVCSFCNIADETTEHLFFRCDFSQQCLMQVKNWLQWKARADTMQVVLKTIRKAKQTKFKTNVKPSSIAALVYLIWKARNDLIWQKKVLKAEELVQRLQKIVKTRTMLVLPQKVKIKDREWFDCL
ncbi:uncharacterized protein LOC133030510 [Cannabis sativa]|uniref:uncharacterized protein LOC133030510 n=1 Tax=Cannabis sativa TaxID=3483 RepID=UPI0029C9DDFB|nr:uncharacterized protein LOC133030510 [Cannabis sativa]